MRLHGKEIFFAQLILTGIFLLIVGFLGLVLVPIGFPVDGVVGWGVGLLICIWILLPIFESFR